VQHQQLKLRRIGRLRILKNCYHPSFLYIAFETLDGATDQAGPTLGHRFSSVTDESWIDLPISRISSGRDPRSEMENPEIRERKPENSIVYMLATQFCDWTHVFGFTVQNQGHRADTDVKWIKRNLPIKLNQWLHCAVNNMCTVRDWKRGLQIHRVYCACYHVY